MTVSVPLYDLLIEFLAEANKGLQEAIEASADQPSIFTAPQIDVELRCSVIWDGGIGIAPSNATASNYYNAPGDSMLNIQFKLRPR